MKCKFCGNEIEEGAEFCFICGQPVTAEEPAPVQQPAETEKIEQPVVEQPDASGVYIDPVQPVAPVAPVEEPIEEKGKKKKKAKKVKDPNAPGKFVMLVCFLFAIIGAIIYKKTKKTNPEKAIHIANAIFLGLDIKLFIIVIVLGKKFMM